MCPLCGQPGVIADTRGGRWCWRCVARLLSDVRRLQALPTAQLGTLVAMLHDAKARFLAEAAIGSVPFDEGS